MIEQVINRRNMHLAHRHVLANKGYPENYSVECSHTHCQTKRSRKRVNYFRMASIHGKLKDIDSWVRNRLRYCIWHNWKKPERKRKNLVRLGVDHGHAYAWSRTRMGGSAVAQSPILVTTITLERLRKRGYEPMLEHYLKVSPQLNEPLYTRPYVQWCERRTSSVTTGEAVYSIGCSA